MINELDISLLPLFGALVFFAAMAAVGVWLMFAEMRRVYRARTWPTVAGKILDSWVTELDSNGPIYNVRVEYEYTILEQRFTGYSYMIGAGVRARSKADDLRASYAPGSEIQIRYDPARPVESQIAGDYEPGISLGVILVAILLIGASIFFAYTAITRGVEIGSDW